MIEIVDRLPETSLEAKWSAILSEVQFQIPGKLIGGIGRRSFVAPREVWVSVLPGFTPRDAVRLRPWVREAAQRFDYVQARVELGARSAARFAFFCGFMWEEDTAAFHLFSVRK